MGTVRTGKSDSGYFESYANRGMLLTEVMSVRILFGEAHIADFGILYGLSVYSEAPFTGETGLTAGSGQCSGMATPPVASRRPTRWWRNSHYLRGGMLFRLTETPRLLANRWLRNDRDASLGPEL
jgi:hypothetical protein